MIQRIVAAHDLLMWRAWERGQGIVEYALILVFVSVALSLAMVNFRTSLIIWYTNIDTALQSIPKP